MTDEEGVLAPVPTDAVLQTAQETGKLPVHWWTSDSCWRMLAKLAGQFSNSTMVPASFRNEPGNVMVALAAGMPLGLSPLACLQSIAVINGKPTLYGDAVIAQVLAHPSLERIEEDCTGSVAKEDRAWSITVVRRLKSGSCQAVTRTFAVADAKKAGLWKKTGPWTQYPDRMLYNRARTLAVRDTFADVLQGTTIAADRDEVIKEVTDVQVRDEPPAPLPVQQVSSLAPDPTPEPPKAKPKRKRTASQKKLAQEALEDQQERDRAAEALAKELEQELPPPETYVNAKGQKRQATKFVGLYQQVQDEKHDDGSVAFCAQEGTVLHRYDQDWMEVTSLQGVFFDACCDVARAGLLRAVGELFLDRGWSKEQAMDYMRKQHSVDTDKVRTLAHTNLNTLAAVVLDLR